MTAGRGYIPTCSMSPKSFQNCFGSRNNFISVLDAATRETKHTDNVDIAS